MTSDVLTIRQVAAEVGITRQAVQLAIRDGRLTASVIVGKHRRCTRAEVDAWLARRQQIGQRRPTAAAMARAARLDALYGFIVEHKRAHGGRCPTQEQMVAALSVGSRSTIQKWLRLLEVDGRIVLEGDGQTRSVAIPGERWLAPGEGECDVIQATTATPWL
jgi:excisionase family DNA binding protein